ncbi:hypothetical protein [Alkalihalobacterium chitinilyticum]|uniref:Uncharacterized protein n=1 Tax=Alkalihalobacterium chitinilyticum TaxID=2980103 RepID=A0ABT5VD84_9BACI|nr:hypothetical protein [Alkalihalobacterium chitinilyticum]MDE5413406.1 hypothetical protein [Alkalihalobacterium chitinilyticum]
MKILLKKLVPILVTVVFTSACGLSDTVQSNDDTDINEVQRLEPTVSNLSASERKHHWEYEDNSNETLEGYPNGKSWNEIGVEIISSRESLLTELDLFYSALEKKELPEYTIDYTFYLHNVLLAYEQGNEFSTHYNLFMDVVPKRIHNLQELQLHTKEVDFVREYYLEAMIVHHDAIQSIGEHSMDINNEIFDPQIKLALNDTVREGYHLLALVGLQLIKIGEMTDIIELDEVNELKRFVDYRLIEEKL